MSMPSPPPQPVPGRSTRSKAAANNLAVASSSYRTPSSYGPMIGMSFTNGGGLSFENRPRSVKWGNGAGSYGARFYGDGMDSPSQVLSTSITMEPSSFAASASAFGLPPSAMSSSFQRRSYAAAVAGRENLNTLSTSLASMAFQPMSFGTSYSKSKVTNLMASQSDAELTKGYQCCEQTHEGLHALLEHVEDAHPFSDPDMPNDTGFSPMTHAMDLEFEELDTGLSMIDERVPSGTGSTRSSLSPGVVPNYPLPPSTSASSSKPPTPNEQPCFLMPSLQISDVLTSPHDAESSMNAANPLSASSSPPEGSLATPTTSAQPSPVFVAPKLGPTRGGFFGTNMPRPPAQQRRFDRAFNEVVAGKKDQMPGDRSAAPMAVAPGVLFASAVASLGIPTTPAVSRRRESEDTSYTDDASKAQLEPAMPQPSLFTSHKPWRCPNPGCNKAYRQSNGLKYHQQRGQCDFAIVDAVDLGVSVEQAEERSRPFVCAVRAGCMKRYRQMNGLKYHYLNSGEHGQYGLRMLQNGTHPQPLNLPAPQPKRPVPPPQTTPSRSATAPYNVPNRPRPGTWPVKPAAPRPVTQPLAVQRGRDAVLFAALGSDPLDVMVRMDS